MLALPRDDSQRARRTGGSMSPLRPGEDPENGSARPASAAKTPARKAWVQAHRRHEAATNPAAMSEVPAVPTAELTAITGPVGPDGPAATAPPATTARIPGRSASRKNVRGARPAPRPTESPATSPVLVRQVRGGVVESRHRGSVVEVGIDGSIRRLIGDPETVVNLRSAVKPFGLVSLVEAGGVA